MAFAVEPPASLDEVFPSEALLPAQAEALLTAEQIGPPATVYDARTRSGAGDPLTAAVEQELFGKDYDRLVAPDALRRFGGIMDQLMRSGRPMALQQMFVAEHVGLADVPTEAGRFMTGKDDPAEIAAFVSALIKDDLKDPSVRAIALHIDRDEERRTTTGTLWMLQGEVEFEPFPRRWEVGQRASIPGLPLSKASSYQLWVSFGGVEVRDFPIVGADGRFDIDVPLPAEPGVYRVAMAAQKKRRMPDSPFFFSLYVGVDPPTAFDAPFDVQDDMDVSLEQFEDDVAARINATRQEAGLPALTLVDARERMRSIVAGAPRKDLARFRYFSRHLSVDPLPGEVHGLWHPTFAGGRMAADAAWVSLENPISRATLLSPDLVGLAMGGDLESGTILLVGLEATPDAGSAADLARDALSQRVAGGLKRATGLEAELDAVAGRIASGKMPFRGYFGPIKKLHKQGKLLGGGLGSTALVVPPGDTPDLSAFNLPSGAKVMAVGNAVGDLGRGDGVQYTVLVIVVATEGG